MSRNRLPIRSFHRPFSFPISRNDFENVFIDSVLPAIHLRNPFNGNALIESAHPRLNELLSTNNIEGAMRLITTLVNAGVPRCDIYASLFSPMMLEIGKMWDRDELSFYEAGHQIEGLLHLLHAMNNFDFVTGTNIEKTVLTISLQNEGHTFGLSIIEQMYRDAGWQVDTQQLTSFNQLVRYLERNYYSLIGISLTSEACTLALDDMIWSIRNYSCNRNVKILLGGFLVTQNSKAFECFGADAIAIDGPQAIEISESLITKQSECVRNLTAMGTA